MENPMTPFANKSQKCWDGIRVHYMIAQLLSFWESCSCKQYRWNSRRGAWI